MYVCCIYVNTGVLLISNDKLNPPPISMDVPVSPCIRCNLSLLCYLPDVPSSQTVGEDVAWRKTRREEQQLITHPAQTPRHASGSVLPRGPCHWQKHSGLRGSLGARVPTPLRSADREARAGRCGTVRGKRCSSRYEPVNQNLPELKLFTDLTSTMQTGRLIVTQIDVTLCEAFSVHATLI